MSRVLIALLISTFVFGGPVSGQAVDGAGSGNPRGTFQLTDGQIWRGVALGIPPGSPIKVKLARGERINAVLVSVSDEGIVIKPKGRLPEAARAVAFNEIDVLEVDGQRGLSAGKAAAIGIGAGAAGGLAFLLVMLAAFAD